MGCKGSSVRITPSRPKFPESRLFERATGFFHGHSLARLRMKITLQRPSGFLRNSVARALSLTVFLNGEPIGKLATGESKVFPLPDEGGVLQVGISWQDEGLEPINRDPDRRISGCSISSQGLALGPADDGATLQAVTAGWVILDLFSLYLLPGLRQRVFRIRRVVS